MVMHHMTILIYYGRDFLLSECPTEESKIGQWSVGELHVTIIEPAIYKE